MTASKKSDLSFHLIVLSAILIIYGLSMSRIGVIEVDRDELFQIQLTARPWADFFSNFWVLVHLIQLFLAKLLTVTQWDVFHLRLGSVIAGTLRVPLIYRLSRYLFEPRVGVLSAILLSFTTTHIRYATNIRGYSLMVTLSVIVIYCFSRALRTGQKKWWVSLAIFMALDIYNHIHTVFLGATLFVFLLGWLWRQPEPARHFKNIALCGGLTLLLLAPMGMLALTSQDQNDNLSAMDAMSNLWPVGVPPLSLQEPLSFINPFIQISYNFSPTRSPGGLTYIFIAFALLGVFVGLKQPSFRWGTLLLGLIFLLTPFLMSVTTTILGRWFFVYRRYFLFVLPLYLTFSALGMLWLTDQVVHLIPPQGLRVQPGVIKMSLLLPLLLLVISPGISYITEVKTAFNPHAAMRYLHEHVQENDIVLCVPDKDWRVLDRDNCAVSLGIYPELAAKVYILDQLATYETLTQFLNPQQFCVSQGIHYYYAYALKLDCATPPPDTPPARNIWLVLWDVRDGSLPVDSLEVDGVNIVYLPDETGVANTLSQAAQIVLETSHTPLRKLQNYISLAHIHLARGDISRALQLFDEAMFVSRWPEATEQLMQLQSQLSYLPLPLQPTIQTEVVWNDEIVLVGLDQDLSQLQPAPGDTLLLTFYWQARQPLLKNYKVFLHLLDQQGTLVASFDYFPFAGSHPLPDWTPGQTLRENRVFDLPADLSPGTYTLVLGFYDAETLERLPLMTNDEDQWPLVTWELDKAG